MQVKANYTIQNIIIIIFIWDLKNRPEQTELKNKKMYFNNGIKVVAYMTFV